MGPFCQGKRGGGEKKWKMFLFLVSFFYMSSDWRDDYCEQLDDKTFGNDDFQGIPGRC